MATKDIKAGGAYVELLLKDEGFVQRLGKAKNMLFTFAAGVVSVRGVVDAARATFNALKAPVEQFVEAGAELERLSRRTGAAVESLSAIQHAAERTKVSMGAVESALLHMQSRRIDPSQFDDMLASIAAIEDPLLRVQAANRAFGSSGEALLPMVDRFASLKQEASDLGLVMNGETAASAARLKESFTVLWETLSAGTRAVGQAIAPFMEVALPAVQAFATMSLESIQGWAQGLSDNVSSIANFVTTVWSTTLDWWHKAQATALSGITYLTNNWQLLFETALVSAELAVVRFANQSIYFFSEVIPGYLSWFFNNWRDVFTDVANMTATVASNIWENLKNLWDAIVGLFSGEGFNFEWTGLTEGFESAIKELPRIAEREMGPLEKSLQDQMNKLGDSLVESVEKHKKEIPSLVAAYVGQGDPLSRILEEQKAKETKRAELLSNSTPDSRLMQDRAAGAFSAAALVAMGGAGDGPTKGEKAIIDATNKQTAALERAIKERKGLGP